MIQKIHIFIFIASYEFRFRKHITGIHQEILINYSQRKIVVYSIYWMKKHFSTGRIAPHQIWTTLSITWHLFFSRQIPIMQASFRPHQFYANCQAQLNPPVLWILARCRLLSSDSRENVCDNINSQIKLEKIMPDVGLSSVPVGKLTQFGDRASANTRTINVYISICTYERDRQLKDLDTSLETVRWQDQHRWCVKHEIICRIFNCIFVNGNVCISIKIISMG